MKVGFIIGLPILILDLVLKSFSGTLILNSGTALGISADNTFMLLVHLSITIAGLAYVYLVSLEKEHDSVSVLLITISLVVAVSNFIDRVVFGAVRDYINLFGIWLNIADSVVVLAIMIIIFRYIHEEIRSHNRRQRKKA